MSGDENDLLDLAYPYALDAVVELERRGIEKRLSEVDAETAAEFAATVRDVRETLAAMTAGDSLQPPAALEDSLLRALDARRAAPTPTPASHRIRSRRRWLAAAAAAVVLAVGGGVAVVVVNRTEPEHGITAQLVRDQPDARSRTVPVATGGTLTVHTSQRLAAASVSFDAISDPATGRSYQLWLVPASGDPRSAGILATTEGTTVIGHYDTTDTLAMTVEPQGGSPRPTTEPIAAIPLS
ncbi:anti-sigma factor [Nocardia bovistercoris]|uniref:Regulator of SigK n=1 Tax=Nocardia bovistercoris TaxID=2785916 RepID=A0A931IHT9_9NOCA|nr:anti-sigma factor [Nocardia bovistercoris]MBH0781676.1 anti-sigma factor [Nocardia bovistercoris]